MALVWSVEHVADYEKVTSIVATEDDPSNGVKKGDEIWNPVTMALVWASIDVGLPGISKENAAEFYARLHVIEAWYGPKLIRAVDPDTGERPRGVAAFITPEEVEAHIGLSVNVTPESRAKWVKRQSDYFVKSLQAKYDKTVRTNKPL